MSALIHLLTYATIWIIGTIGLAGMGAVGWGLWPARSESIRGALADGPGRPFLLGLVNVLAYVVVVVLLHRAGLGRPVAILLLGWGVGLLLSGLPGTLASLGERIMGIPEPPSAVRAALLGTVSLGAATMLPVVGWILLVLFVLTAFGAGLTVFLTTLGRSEGAA
jgi:hypothetical protein